MELIKPKVELLFVTPNADALIEQATRVSHRSVSTTPEARKKLLHSCLMRGHMSVFEFAHATLSWTTSRSVTHQLVRHRLASFCQESQRYCDYKGGLRFVDTGIRDPRYLVHLQGVEAEYRRLRDSGVAPERARDVLPNCAATEIIISANFRQWMHMMDLRITKHAEAPIKDCMTQTLLLLRGSSCVWDMYIGQREQSEEGLTLG